MGVTELMNLVREYEVDYGALDDNNRKLTLSVLKRLREVTDKSGGLRQAGVLKWREEHWYTRLASALTFHFLSTELEKIDDYCLQLMPYRKLIKAIFESSGYRGGAHLLQLASESKELTNPVLNPQQAKLMLFLTPIDDVPLELIEAISGLDSKAYYILAIAWLSELSVLTENGERNRNYLIENHERLLEGGVELVESNNVLLFEQAWMHCSYASTLKRNELKITLNKIICHYLDKNNFVRFEVEKENFRKKNKPKILIVLERFKTPHAMYRCYAAQIEKLKEKFHTISLSTEEQIDEQSKKVFHQSLTFERDKLSLSGLLIEINKLSPDIIYYPSLGMSSWTIVIANLRLAPLQAMSMGHPATSHSKAIDYIFSPYLEGQPQKMFSEKLFFGPAYGDNTPPQIGRSELLRLVQGKNQTSLFVEVAINASVMKLSGRFLSLCKKLQKESSKPVRFHFFPAFGGADLDGITARLEALFDDISVYPPMPYKDFMKKLSACDLSLSPFPFGNTNSTVDACCLGIPVINLFGQEPGAQSDKNILTLTGVDQSYLTVLDEGAYYDAAKTLICCASIREKIRRELLEGNLYLKLSERETSSASDAFLRLMNYAVELHEGSGSSIRRADFPSSYKDL